MMIDYLSPQEIAREIVKVTYKPGWAFSLYTHPFEGLCLRIEFTVPNSYRPDELQEQGVNVPIPPLISVEQLHDWLMWRLKTVELHELQEFYKVDGVMRYDPHSDKYWKQAAQVNRVLS